MPQVLEFAQPELPTRAPAEAPEVSVVVPVFNEFDNLGDLVDRIHAALAPTGRRFELIVVDDGSRDGS
ncbi:glycosyltransferase, partial [Salmonella enterica subsp. enterica serovar Typhimurium]|nr:glycosyltransferase [Salmonella enterica subsp. enterica serovar Typhimurium]